MSTVTALYNHFGLHNAPWIMALLVHRAADRELLGVFKASLAAAPPPHADVRGLMSHSRLVRFVVLLRGPFMRAFEEQREHFPASYSAEAYFLGTVLHSLDHLGYTRSLKRGAFAR